MSRQAPLLVVSTGCPAGIGPEVSVAAAAKLKGLATVLLGDEGTLRAAAELRGVPQRRLVAWDGKVRDSAKIYFAQVGEPLTAKDRVAGKPNARAGVAQLEYIEAGFTLVKSSSRAALVTGPVSKAAIAHSGLSRARGFLGHTEWLQALDGADSSVMCFVCAELATSLVTTHVPIGKVPRSIDAAGVSVATVELGRLLQKLGKKRPKLAVASLNPHAGESELLGGEEAKAIAPGIARAQKILGRSATLTGPVGAETAYRKAASGGFDGVVAMYHDQATIPMKLLAFGTAVNVTAGLSIVRTSVDHGTAYDIAWRGVADAGGMQAALELAARILAGERA
ncbi:MAG TPA: 4-hydroxythreonine-4-phosphate dehydrogenase PdxA [Polyangiaceae bacterium]|nr:4-hydroxythreonine-4-phosphate dehydrogenase PdxA [Polyangiaceae bacterium]